MINQDIYVMRLWCERSHHKNSNDAWRITITDTRNQEKFHFANLDKLVAFFKERLEQSENSRD